MIHCIMKTGLPLSEIASCLLYSTARDMFLAQKRSRKIVNDDCYGMVHSEFESLCFGGLSGIRFQAEIVTPKGKTSVDYMICTRDIEPINIIETKPEKFRWRTIRSKRPRHWEMN